MTDLRRIASNFAFLTAAQGVAFLCGLGTTILLARGLGPESYGLLGFGQAFVGFGALFVVLGTDTYGSRQIARAGVPQPRLVANIVGYRIVAAAVVLPSLLAIAWWSGVSGPAFRVIAIQALGVVAVIVSLDFVFQGLQRMGAIALRQAAASSLVLAGAALLVAAPEDVLVAAALPVAATVVTSIWLLDRLRRIQGGLFVAFDRAAWRTMLAVSVPIGLGGMGVAVYQYVDILMLGYLVPGDDVGRYVAMGRLYIVIVTAGNLLAAAFAPALSRMVAADAPERALLFRRFLGAVLVVGAPAAAAFAALPSATLGLFFGEAYREAATVFAIVMAGALAFLVTSATSTVLVAWDDERFHVKALAATGALNAGLNAVLIPATGMAGAALATLVCAVFLAATELWRISRRHGASGLGVLAHGFGLVALLVAAAIAGERIASAAGFVPHPALVLPIFGGFGLAVFAAAAAATGFVRPRRLVATLFRRDASGV